MVGQNSKPKIFVHIFANDFRKFFTCTFCGKFSIKWLLYILMMMMTVVWCTEKLYVCLSRQPRTPIRQETAGPSLLLDKSSTL